MKLLQWLKSPKCYVFTTLVLYLLAATLGVHDTKGLQNAGIAVAVCVSLDFLISLVKGRKRFVPDSAAITGLILALILGMTTTWPSIAATSAIAIVSKHLLSFRKKPLFNPAAFGLLVSIPLFHTGQSWWGAFGDLPAWTVGFLLVGGYIVVNRVNKFPLVFSYLATFLALLFVLDRFDPVTAFDAYRPPFINAVLFFSFFMLTDPPTSPAKVWDQILFGFLASAAGVTIYALFGGLSYLFIGLFIGSLYHLARARAARAPIQQFQRQG